MKYRKKPIEIEAVQNDGVWSTVRDWMIDIADGPTAFPIGTHPPITRNEDGSLNIHTLEGIMTADVNDWIIKGVKDEFYPVKNDIFRETYEEVIDK